MSLHHTATHCNTLQHTATHCNTLQHSATHCNTLQHTATHCNTLQHTTAGGGSHQDKNQASKNMHRSQRLGSTNTCIVSICIAYLKYFKNQYTYRFMTQEHLPQLPITPPIDIHVCFCVVGIHLCMVTIHVRFHQLLIIPPTFTLLYVERRRQTQYSPLCLSQEHLHQLLITLHIQFHTVDISVHFDILDILSHVKCLHQLLITPLIDMHLHS